MHECRRNLHTGPLVSVPGLAPAPQVPRPPADPTPPCPRCDLLGETLKLVHQRLRVAHTRIDGAIRLGKEAAERSAARVGAYDVLQRVLVKHGTPFKDGDKLPKEYKDLFPRHHLPDGIMLRTQKKKARLATGSSEANRSDSRCHQGWLDTEGSDGVAGSESGGHKSSEEDGRSVSGGSSNDKSRLKKASKDSDESESSTESIPTGFRPDASEDEGETDLFDVYEGDYEGDDNWELDPEEPDSDVDIDD
jgi:hypothetical protein